MHQSTGSHDKNLNNMHCIVLEECISRDAALTAVGGLVNIYLLPPMFACGTAAGALVLNGHAPSELVIELFGPCC